MASEIPRDDVQATVSLSGIHGSDRTQARELSATEGCPAFLVGDGNLQEKCPLLAQSGHSLVHCTCPLSGVKRTWLFALHMSAYDAVDGASSAASKWYRLVASKPERFKEVRPGNETAFEVFEELARTRRRNADKVDPGIGRTRL